MGERKRGKEEKAEGREGKEVSAEGRCTPDGHRKKNSENFLKIRLKFWQFFY